MPAGVCCGPKLKVSSPDSLAGVIVGSPAWAAEERSGRFLKNPRGAGHKPGTRVFGIGLVLLHASDGGGIGRGMGTPNFVSLAFESATRFESGYSFTMRL